MDPLFHLLIPPLLLLAFFPKLDKKLILILAPLTFIMDFDTIVPGYHRILFHNIFFVIILSLIIYFIKGKIASLISLYYLISHIILDIKEWGMALFYPFYNKFIYIVANIVEKEGQFLFNFAISTTQPTAQQIAQSQHHFFTEITFMILMLIIILVISKLKSKK